MVWCTASVSQIRATKPASPALAARRPWSTVAASTDPGNEAAARNSRARLSGPPETAIPNRARVVSVSAPRSARNRSIGSDAGPRGEAPAIAILLPAARVGARLRQALANEVAHVGIDVGELGIDPARLRPAVQPGERLAEEEKAVGRPRPARILLVIGKEDPRRGGRLVVVEIGAPFEVAHPARPGAVREAL